MLYVTFKKKKMSRQITDTLMMIRPVAFHLNEQTAVNNYYQKAIEGLTNEEIQLQALKEFDGFVEKLKANGIKVIVFGDTIEPAKPDSIFPNNWVSFHESGEIILYPMYAENRRMERREDILESLSRTFKVSEISAFTDWENKNKFLEGTGSLILDRQHKIAYAAISERTNPDVLEEFSAKTGYKVVPFTANQTVNGERKPIYHTNVMMCVGDAFAVLCSQSIDNEIERETVISTLEKSGKEVVFISEKQKERFAGNMLQVQNEAGEKFIIMSESAFKVLSEDQRNQLGKYGQLLYSPLDTIESLGGGSARCMMAEVFLPRRDVSGSVIDR